MVFNENQITGAAVRQSNRNMEDLKEQFINFTLGIKNAVGETIERVRGTNAADNVSTEEVQRVFKEAADGLADGAKEMAEEAKIAGEIAKEKIVEAAEVAKKTAGEVKVKAEEVSREAKKETARGTSFVTKKVRAMLKRE